ncbi:type III secretion HpaP family protein [Halodesulfovibrio spirochaetisodalis]|uniref:Flagellar hook-length control protein-like C-terminal domain-containing protein n=1 Tax=Halodesulfovibrio spirochaetisodalis TaxID=1560234 RepID=A0A1B7X9A6_9BACT|nr:type III secretion HpaP family protein [Halodesulfovibrio spirochaetisodalis]OBQ45954.1 hypothetical protein SP90_15160 [Halodesulfovibrio spirochaetisodalis]
MAVTPSASSSFSAPAGQEYKQAETKAGQGRAQESAHKTQTTKQEKITGNNRSAGKASGMEKAPSGAAVDEFVAALKGNSDKGSEKGSDQGDSRKQDSPSDLFAGMGDAILSSRMGGQQPQVANNQIQTPQGEAQVKLTSEMQNVAQQILVSAPKHGGQSEVIIRLEHSSLPDTAVKIAYEPSGLVVKFNTQNVNAHQTLVENQLGLKERLETDNPGVRVVVNDQTASDGRSKGLLNFDQEEDE